VMTGAALEPHEPTAEQAQRYRLTAMEGSAAPSLRRPADLRWLVLSGSLAGLIMSVTVLRLAVARAAADPTVLGVFVAVALMVGFMAEEATRRTRQAARAAEAARRIAEADRMRTVLLATVSHDLRTPLAAAKAAVGCLRSRAVQLTADDHAELLATAEESLDQLTRLAAGLLDASRLQAGKVPVCVRPADLGDIIASSLDDLDPHARVVRVDIPFDLPQVMTDPAVMERVIANLAGNALRYSPAGSPLALRASVVASRVQLRVIDRGPGIPEADRDRAFLPFQRLGDTSKTTGVGLGLAVARDMTQAMGGTLEAEETPGGGLTMAISLPAAPRLRHSSRTGVPRRSAASIVAIWSSNRASTRPSPGSRR
jgi:K+-sensing histidine kinase KdpD